MVHLRNYKDSASRRAAIEENLHVALPHIGSFSIDEETPSKTNCENMIGTIQVPIGVAGPLTLVHGKKKGTHYLPLATTEGALVASISRGAKAISEEKGATVVSKHIGITRAPVFEVDNILAGEELITWTEKNFLKLKKTTEKTSSHLKLLEVRTWSVGRNVYLRFRFDSEDAMGMNMSTIAVHAAVDLIERETRAKCIALSGNMCVDKKPNALNFILGRGYSVSADIVLSQETLKNVLKTDADSMVRVYQRKVVQGSMLSGTIGANAHFANILSALFLATGQDIAHIAECSMGITTLEKLKNGKLYISVYLPDLVVGAVGGGTKLETQKEALSILGIKGGNKGKNGRLLAEIITGAVLAGELSLLASLSQGTLSCAHQTLGRN